MTRAEEAEAELSASRAEVVALREALEEAARRFEGLSHIHDGNPSDAMADMPPLDYARHMLWEARRECREGAREARAARWGGVARRGTYRNPWKSASAKGICGPAPSEFLQASAEQGRNASGQLAHG